MNDKAKELLSNMKSTGAARYNAAKRLEERERSLTRLTAFTSTYVIGLTVLPYFIHLPAGSADRLNLLTFVLGVTILVASLIQYSARDGVNAEQHYRCGLDIGEMRRRLKITADAMDDTTLAGVADEYALILHKYSINHDQVDYEQYQIERSDEATKLSWLDRVSIPIRISYARHLPNAILAIVTALTIWLVVAIIGPEWRLAAPANAPASPVAGETAAVAIRSPTRID